MSVSLYMQGLWLSATRLGYVNGALRGVDRLAYKLGEFETSFEQASKSKAAFPAHSDTVDLLKQLDSHFATV